MSSMDPPRVTNDIIVRVIDAFVRLRDVGCIQHDECAESIVQKLHEHFSIVCGPHDVPSGSNIDKTLASAPSDPVDQDLMKVKSNQNAGTD